MPFKTSDGVDHPVSLYAASKKANELMAHSYSHLYGLPPRVCASSPSTAPWGRPDMALFKFVRAIPKGSPSISTIRASSVGTSPISTT